MAIGELSRRRNFEKTLTSTEPIIPTDLTSSREFFNWRTDPAFSSSLDFLVSVFRFSDTTKMLVQLTRVAVCTDSPTVTEKRI
jgi:hypothetical protein